MSAPGRYVGDLTLRSHFDESGKITGIEILAAPERTRISLPLLDQIRTAPAPGVHYDEHVDVLTIHGTNRDVAYRLEDADPEADPNVRAMTRIELG